MSLRALLLAAVAAVCITAPAFAFQTNFAADMGDATPFSVTTGGTTLSFAGSSDPSTFYVGSTTGLYSFSTGLGDFGSYGGDTLTVNFSTPLTTPVHVVFGLEDAFGLFGGDTLSVDSNTGVNDTFTTTLDALTLAEPEGSGVINAPGATSLTITSANAFAIASIYTVPEPASMAMLLVGLAGLGVARHRRRG